MRACHFAAGDLCFVKKDDSAVELVCCPVEDGLCFAKAAVGSAVALACFLAAYQVSCSA